MVKQSITVDRVYLDSPVKIKAEVKTISTKLTIDVKGAKNKTVDSVTTPSETTDTTKNIRN